MTGRMVVPEEALEAAAEAIAGYRFADWPAQAYEGEAYAALEAAAPFIASKALEEAADAIVEDPYEDYAGWLRARAAAVRGEA